MSAHGALDVDRWRALVGRVAPELDAAASFDVLVGAYGDSARGYHDESHIVACLEELDSAKGICERPDEVEFAIWLHDVVYRSRGGDNETESADLAVLWLVTGGATTEVADRIREMILATEHAAGDEGTAGSATGDVAVMLDIDLSILGADEERFAAYEAGVRHEYRWVPGPLYRRKRAEVLRGFMERDPLFRTDHFRERLEGRAKQNLNRAVGTTG